jgi:hypothetical protein
MSQASLMYWQDQHGKTQPRVLRLQYKITGAKTVAPLVPNSVALTAFDAIASQAVIDAHLGTTNEFLLAAFDATAMGNDAFAAIVDMKGQAKQVLHMVARCYSASNTVVTRQVQGGALTASTLETAVAVGADGNIACKVDFGNTPDMDALTAGTIEIEIHWISK